MTSGPFIDALGRIHRPVSSRDTVRIASLVPSLTELLFDLGLGHLLVARTGFCIHPAPGLAAVAKVGGTKDVNIGKLRELAPTHVVVNIDENDKPVVDQLASFIPNVIVTHPDAPRDNLGLYRLLGGIFNAGEAAEMLARVFEQEHALLTAQAWRPRKVLYCIWQDPWMTVAPATYIGQMLSLVGWQQVEVPAPATGSARYPRFDWSAALAGGIDEVLLSSEPYRFTGQHADLLERQLGVPVSVIDGEMISWYGSRAIRGLRYLGDMAKDGSAL
ncbi:helical backbone metal receptor [Lacisediminimonas profundi]|uniref:helical backbone metal receptor n=1 Tax=Lacisediminimonas profundi TaxID=2603856 RepID=UPI00124BA195|nr:helical backbone metal receptor [Lacisediminimonas profundi]